MKETGRALSGGSIRGMLGTAPEGCPRVLLVRCSPWSPSFVLAPDTGQGGGVGILDVPGEHAARTDPCSRLVSLKAKVRLDPEDVCFLRLRRVAPCGAPVSGRGFVRAVTRR